jgi:hypothetical protein
MKLFIMRVLVGIVVVAVIFSPYLLIIDFVRFAPIVLMIWILSFAYYMSIRRRVERTREQEPGQDENEPGEKKNE